MKIDLVPQLDNQESIKVLKAQIGKTKRKIESTIEEYKKILKFIDNLEINSIIKHLEDINDKF